MKFSVVIPSYNKATHLRRSIESVLSQTFQDFELVLVDDASTDGSLAIARELLAGTPNTRIIARPASGRGGYAARNAGVSAASGEFVAFLDADDSWETDFLEAVNSAILQYPDASIFSTAYTIRNLENSRRSSFRASGSPENAAVPVSFSSFLDAAIQNSWPIHTSSVVIRRSLLLQVGGFPESRCNRGGDRDTWLRCVAEGSYVWINRVCANYFVDSENMVTRTTKHPAEHCMQSTIETLARDTKLANYRTKLARLGNAIRLPYLRQQRAAGLLKLADLNGIHFLSDPLFFLRVLAMIITQKHPAAAK